MTRAEFQPVIDRMRARLADVQRIVNGISDQNLRGAGQAFVANTGRWIDAWASTGVDRVLAGTETAERWASDGQDIANQMSDRYLQDLGDISGWFHGIELSVANAIHATVDDYAAKVQQLADKVKALHEQRTELWHYQQALAPVQTELPAATQTALWGPGIAAASKSLDALDKILAKAQESVTYLRTGKATLTNGPQGAEVVQVTPAGVGDLGAVVTLIVLGVVAVAITTAVALYVVYQGKIRLAELALQAKRLDIVAKHPELAPVIDKLLGAETKLAQAEHPTTPSVGGSLLKTLKWVGIGAGVLGLGWAAWELFGGTGAEPRRAAA